MGIKVPVPLTAYTLAFIQRDIALNTQKIETSVRKWLDTFVVGMNLCPFAKRELVKQRVRFTVSEATTEDELLQALQAELELLNADPSIETTLLIHPAVLGDFLDYNQFLDIADALLLQMELDGVYQVASFHPDYQFGGTAPWAAENYTNRSPYPILHLLREESLDRVLGDNPDADQIPQRNIDLMNATGEEKLAALLADCFK
jgi:hypothetical protein